MSSPGDNPKIKERTMWSLVPRIMVAPSSGWEQTMEEGPHPDIAILRFLLPLSLVSGLSEIICLYTKNQSFPKVLVSSVITFCAFFIGYFVALLICRVGMPKDAKGFIETAYGKLMTMTGVATLAIFNILENVLPMLDFIFEFFPLWTAYLIFVGMRITVVSAEKQIFAFGVMTIAVVLSPFVIEWLLILLT